MRRIVISLSLVGVLSVGAAACGSSNDTGARTTAAGTAAPATAVTTAATADHNDADVAFVQQMIPHHQQALMMATMAMDAKAGASVAVKALATKISAAQTPEIDLMQGWLDQWAVPMTATTDAHAMGGSTPMSTGMGAMGGSDGMMTDADMQALAAATGPAFDTMWLTGMIAHHQGAIAMATTEKQSGKNADALKLADSIASGQAAEVTEMQQLLAAG